VTPEHYRRNLHILFWAKAATALPFSFIFASLMLYLSEYVGLERTMAAQMTALVLGLKYVLPLLGGVLGQRWFSFKSLFAWGAACELLGLLLLAWLPAHHTLGPWALALILMGCMTASVSLLEFLNATKRAYPGDERRAMLWNYAGANVGIILGYLLTGYGLLHHGEQYLLPLLALLPMPVVGWLVYALDYRERPTQVLRYAHAKLVLLLAILVAFFAMVLAKVQIASSVFFGLSCAAIVALFLLARKKQQGEARQRLSQLAVYYGLYVGFWLVYMLTPTYLFYLLAHQANLIWGHWQLPVQWLENIDPIVIVLGGPALAALLRVILPKARQRDHVATTSVFLALAFVLLAVALTFLQNALDHQAQIQLWQAASYIFLVALAELVAVPEGFTLAGRLAPKGKSAWFSGAFMATIGVAVFLSGRCAVWLLQNSGHARGTVHGLSLLALLALSLAAVCLLLGWLWRDKKPTVAREVAC
jgi:POT family proton-dependent oligopeptide transporter